MCFKEIITVIKKSSKKSFKEETTLEDRVKKAVDKIIPNKNPQIFLDIMNGMHIHSEPTHFLSNVTAMRAKHPRFAVRHFNTIEIFDRNKKSFILPLDTITGSLVFSPHKHLAYLRNSEIHVLSLQYPYQEIAKITYEKIEPYLFANEETLLVPSNGGTDEWHFLNDKTLKKPNTADIGKLLNAKDYFFYHQKAHYDIYVVNKNTDKILKILRGHKQPTTH